jgi:hypothetical protein
VGRRRYRGQLTVGDGRESRPQRLSDPNQLHRIREPNEADVVRLRAKSLCSKDSVGVLNGLPSFLDRREIPARSVGTRLTSDPSRVERQPATDGKVFHGVAPSERLVTMQAVEYMES